MNDNRTILYNALKNEGYTDIGENQEEFNKLLEKPENVRVAYDAMRNSGYTDIGDSYEAFAAMLVPNVEQKTTAPVPAQQPKGGENGFTLTAGELELEEEAVEEPKKSRVRQKWEALKGDGNEEEEDDSGAIINPLTPEQVDEVAQQVRVEVGVTPDVKKNATPNHEYGWNAKHQKQQSKKQQKVEAEQKVETIEAVRTDFSELDDASKVKTLERMFGKSINEIEDDFLAATDRRVNGDYDLLFRWATGGNLKANELTMDAVVDKRAIAGKRGYTPAQIEAGAADDDTTMKYMADKQMAELEEGLDSIEVEIKAKAGEAQANWEKEKPAGWDIAMALSTTDQRGMTSADAVRDAMSINGIPTEEAQEVARQLDMINYTRQNIAKAKNLQALAQAEGGGGKQFVAGMGAAILDPDTWTSAEEIKRGQALQGVLDKINDEGEGSLTQAEQKFLESVVMLTAYNEMYAEDVSASAGAGKSFMEIIPFMFEMAINPLRGTGKAAGKKLLKWAEKRFRSNVLKKGTQVLGNIAGSVAAGYGTAATMQLPGTIAGVQERMQGDVVVDTDEDGKLVYGGQKNEKGAATAVYEEFTERMLDTASEMIGAGYASLPFRQLRKWGKGTKVLGWIDNLANSRFGKTLGNFFERTGWHGPIEEFMEEVHVGLLSPALLKDPKLKDFFNEKDLTTTLIAVAVPGAITSSLRTAVGAYDGSFKLGAQEKWKMQSADRTARTLWGENIAQWDEIKSRLDNGSIENTEETLSEIEQAIKDVYADETLTNEQKKAALQYAVYSLQYKTATGVRGAITDERQKMLNEMLNGRYEEGYNTDPDTVNGSTIALANKSLDDAETAVRVALGLQNDASIEDFVGGRSVDEVAMGDEAVADALYTYLEEKARYDGMSERLNAERESEIIEADNSVDAVAHEDGNVYMATLPSTGEAIFITGGKVVLDNEGYIDVNQSEGLVALMPNSKKEAIQAGNIREKVAVENAEAQKAAKRAEIDARYESQLNTFVYSDSEGDHTVMLVGRRGDMVDALIDGRPTEVPAKEFEAIMADATGKQPVVEGGEVKAEGATSGDVVSPVETTQPIEQPGLSNETAQTETVQPQEVAPKVAEVSDFFRMDGKNYAVVSRNEDGSVTVDVDGKRAVLPAETNFTAAVPTDKGGKVLFTEMPAEKTLEYFVQRVPNSQARAQMIENNRKQAESALKKYDKEPNVGTDPDAYEATMNKWEADKKAAQAKVDYWNEVAKRDAEISQSEMRESVESVKPREVIEMTPDEFVANQLGGIKITPESFQKETGTKAEQKQMVGVIAGKEKGGVSIERAAEIIYESYGDELRGLGFNGDMQDVRDMIIDVLSNGNPRSFAKKGLEMRQQADVEQQLAELRGVANALNFESIEEQIAYEESIVPRIMQELKGFDETEYFNNLAENYKNDTTRESENTRGSSELLQGEQSADNAGATNLGEPGQGGEVQGDVYSGGENATPQGNQQVNGSEIPNNLNRDNLSPVEGAAESEPVGQSGVAASGGNGLANAVLEKAVEKQKKNLNDRIREAVTKGRIKQWEKRTGISVRVVESIDEVTNRQARAALEAGQIVKGWIDGNEVVIYLPNIESVEDVDKTYIHEVVAHKGLKILMGKDFDKLCDKVWEMMSEELRGEYLAYIGANLENPTQADMRDAADEYMAYLAESVELTETEKGIWQKIVDAIREFLLGEGVKLTDKDIENLIRASYANLASGNTEGGNGGTMFRLASSNASAIKYDKMNGTNVKEFFDFLRGGMVFEKGKPNVFHIANAGNLLEQYGIKGKFMVGQFTFSRTHTQNEDHNLGIKEWVDVINNLNNPLAITSYKGLPNEYRIYTYATVNGKNICVGVNVSLKEGEIELSNIISAYGRDINNLLGKEGVNLLYPDMNELKRRISQVSTAHNSLLNATSTASADKDNIGFAKKQGNGTKFRKVTPEMDAEYMAAVENGDMETAERLVKEAAKLAMPDTKVVDEDGYPMVVYHGSEEDFNVFDKTKGRANMDIQGMFFSPWDDDARGYGSNVRAFYLNITKPANESTGYKALNKFQGQNGAGIKAREYLVSAGYDGVNNENQEFVAFNPNQIKSADAVTYDDNGNIIPLSERFNEEKEDIRFRIANKNQDVFVSNAQRAVEGIKQEKATPQQWIAMLKKNGGLKAGEEAWLGLEEWLNEKQGAVTKQEILDFIGENKIQIEEVNYQGSEEDLNDSRGLIAKMRGEDFADEFLKAFDIEYGEFGIYDEEKAYELYKRENGTEAADEEEILAWAEGVMNEAQDNARPINSTRLGYTTEGLDNKREIALTVPTVEPYNASDEIHFGDAGNGRAVAWVRFGETTADTDETIAAKKAVNDYLAEMREKYNTLEGEETDAMTAEEIKHLQELTAKEMESGEKKARVLVIDEIQSKRHQDGREKGYATEDYIYAKRERDYLYKKMYEKGLTEEEHERYKWLQQYTADNFGVVPSAPFEKNWHELAMKRMLRLAAEEGFDKVAWTTGEQQAERYNISKQVERIDVEDNGVEEFSDGTPIAKNVALRTANDNVVHLYVDADGVAHGREFDGKSLAEIVGKELAEKIMQPGDFTIEGDGLRIGGEGMKGFYDRMLPSFVQKYTKKWGAKVGEVTMPNLRENNTMHSVDVTPEMKESVMEGQTMFRFIGKKGAENLDKAEEATTRLDNLGVAREMETAGKDAKAIKLATGWERGADGKWRYETEDVKLNRAAELFSLENHQSYPIAESLDKGRVDFNGTIKLADLVNDEELLKAYPEMEEYFVSFEKMDADTKGLHDFANQMIRINKDDISELESTLVHEIQHAIQSAEGFAMGGSTETIDVIKDKARVWAWRNALKETEKEHPELAGTTELEKVLMDEYRTEGLEEYIPTEEQRIKGFNLYARGYDGEGYERAFYAMPNVVAGNGFATYRRLAGEVESRNVEERMGMSPEERRNKLAEETEDVRREDQIFLEDALKSAMMGSRVDARMAEVASHFDGKELSAEQRAVADVFGGKADNLTISVKTQDGNTRNVEMRQGNDLAGAKHSLYAHYGTTKGVINADDLLLIPDVIANGERTENGKKAVYKLDVNGTKYTVVTYVKQNKEEFHNFYSNKKGQPSQSVNASIGDTHSARITEELASADKGSTNSAEMQEGETLFSKKELTPEQKKKQEALKENAKAIRRLHNVTSRYPITALRNLGFALETQEQREMHDRLFAERDAITGESMPAGLQTNPQAMTLQERITESLLKHAEQEKENVEMRLSAIRAYGRDLANVIKLMNAQKGYDKRTVRIFTDLVKMYLRNNEMSGMSSYEIIRLLNLMQKATGGNATMVNRAAVKIAEIITNEHTKQLKEIMEKQMKTGAERVNASGVVVQGGVDIIGKRILNTYKDAINLDDEGFEEKYNDSFKRVGEIQKQLEENGSNTALENQLEEAQAEADAMLLAATYRNEVKAAEADITKIKDELTGKRTKAEKGEITWKEYHEFAKTINSQIVQLRAQQIDAYQKVLHALSGDIYEGVQRARAFREAEAMRVQRIHDIAESDMNGVDKSAERKEPGAAGKTVDMVVYKNPIVRTVMNGLGTYENYMKYFGRDHLDGRGELFNHFMTAFTEAQNKEWKESQNDFNILEAAAQEIFGKKRIGKTYKSIARESTKPSGVILKYWNGGATVERELTIGQLMYLYMTEKQAEGQMKLRNMGLTEEKVQGAVEQLPTKYKKFADYIQSQFLPQMRPRMNEVHQRMFGASMSEVENYFPLKVNMGARQGNDDLNNTADTIPSTITGSVIKRRVNVTPIDLMANAFDVLNEHIVDMEHWAAYAEFIRDNNTLINDKDFKNRVQNTKSVRYGDGETLWKNFVDTARIATGNYKSKADYLAKLMSGANAAKITFGYYTALKQLASMPAFWSDAKIWDAVWYSVNPMGSWRWAIENLPGFEERWKGRTAGNERLGENEYSIHDSRIMKAARMVGMTPNAFVDAAVVASGARAVYKDRLNFYKKLGMTEYEADRRAKNDAAISYNETQQSGQGAYLSTLQKDGGLVALLTTLFRNSQMAFQRRVVGSLVEVGKKLARGEKIREATKQKYIKMGMSEEAAGKQANRDFCKAYAKDITNLAIFGYAMNYVWALMGELPYLLFGDDDEEKEKIWDTAAKMGITGTFEGFTCGNFAKSLYEKHITDGKYAVGLLEAPFEGDLQVVFERFEKDGTIAGVLQLAMFATEMNTGISPQRLIDTVTAFIYYSNGDIDKATRAQLFALRLLKAPQSQQDKLILDETDGADVEEVKSIAEWYIKYKMARNFPLGSEDEKRVDKYANKFVETLKERVEKDYNPEDISVIYDQSSDTEKEILKKKWIEGMDERNGTNVAKSLRKEKLEELLGSPVENAATKALHKYSKVNTYEKLETFEDLERWYEYKVLHDKFKSDYEKIRDGEELSPEERAKAVEHYGVYADKGFKEVINAIGAHKKFIKQNKDPEWRMSEVRRLTDIATEIMKRYE